MLVICWMPAGKRKFVLVVHNNNHHYAESIWRPQWSSFHFSEVRSFASGSPLGESLFSKNRWKRFLKRDRKALLLKQPESFYWASFSVKMPAVRHGRRSLRRPELPLRTATSFSSQESCGKHSAQTPESEPADLAVADSAPYYLITL